MRDPTRTDQSVHEQLVCEQETSIEATCGQTPGLQTREVHDTSTGGLRPEGAARQHSGGSVPVAMDAEQLRPERMARQDRGGLVLEGAARQVESRPVAEGSVLDNAFCGNPAPILPHTKVINLPPLTHQYNENPVLPNSNFSFGENSVGFSFNPSRIISHRRVRVPSVSDFTPVAGSDETGQRDKVFRDFKNVGVVLVLPHTSRSSSTAADASFATPPAESRDQCQ